MMRQNKSGDTMSNRAVILTGMLLVAARCLAATHYVVTNGTPGHTGAVDPYDTWATAGTSIFDVVNAAMTNIEPRVVWVTNGTYYFTNRVDVTNAITIKSVNGRSNTICVGRWLPEPTVNFDAFNIDCPVGSTGILDGFAITNFRYDTWGQGVVKGTVAMENGGHMLNCRIANNYMYDGGGATLGSYCKITNCIIEGNRADRYGGGIVIKADTARTILILDSLIQNNLSTAQMGCGITMINQAHGTISNCVIINNTAPDGGGIGGAGSYSFGINIISCLITGNTAIGGASGRTGLGGGIYLQNDHPYYSGNYALIKDCTIQGNIAKDSGGGVYGMCFTLKNSLISGNTALTNAGGVYGTIITGMVAER